MIQACLVVGSFCLILLSGLAFLAIARLAQALLVRFGSRPVSDDLCLFWARSSSWCGGLAITCGFLGTIFGLVSALPRLSAGPGMDMGAMGDDFSFALSTTAVGLVVAAIAATAESLLCMDSKRSAREAD